MLLSLKNKCSHKKIFLLTGNVCKVMNVTFFENITSFKKLTFKDKDHEKNCFYCFFTVFRIRHS